MGLFDSLNEAQRAALSDAGALGQPGPIAWELARLVASLPSVPKALRLSARLLTKRFSLAIAGGQTSDPLTVQVPTLWTAVHGEWWTDSVNDDPHLARLTVTGANGRYIFGDSGAGIDVGAIVNTDKRVEFDVPILSSPAERLMHSVDWDALAAATPGVLRVTWYGIELQGL